MNYFLISGMENGVKVIEFNNKESLIKYINDYYSDSPVDFMKSVPKDLDYFYHGNHLIIKGIAVVPSPITIIKSYDID